MKTYGLAAPLGAILICALATIALALISPPKKLAIVAFTEWVCVPYEHGLSCKRGTDVARWILANDPQTDP